MVLKDEGTDFDGVVLIRTEAMHGESPDQAAEPVCGIILQAAEEPVLYVAGDTVYYKGVERALEQYRPDVVVLNACGAELMGLGRLIMGAEDVLKVCEAAPDATIIASHMAVSYTHLDVYKRQAERGPIRGTSLYLVLKSNGPHRSKNPPVKFGFSLKTVPANIAKKLPPQRCFKPLFIPFFNFSYKRSTFVCIPESGYTLGSAQRIAHNGSHGETGAFQMGALLLPLSLIHI